MPTDRTVIKSQTLLHWKMNRCQTLWSLKQLMLTRSASLLQLVLRLLTLLKETRFLNRLTEAGMSRLWCHQRRASPLKTFPIEHLVQKILFEVESQDLFLAKKVLNTLQDHFHSHLEKKNMDTKCLWRCFHGPSEKQRLPAIQNRSWAARFAHNKYFKNNLTC